MSAGAPMLTLCGFEIRWPVSGCDRCDRQLADKLSAVADRQISGFWGTKISLAEISHDCHRFQSIFSKCHVSSCTLLNCYSPKKIPKMNAMIAPEAENHAETLLGIDVHDGWILTQKLPRPGTAAASDQTGACFSVGYIATRNDKDAFVKVIDVERVLKMTAGSTLLERLKNVSDTYGYEVSILETCKNARLDRIVQIIHQGELPPPEGSIIPTPFIMFEKADGDVRKIVSRSARLDDAWRLRVLFDVARGLQQLHGQQIVHQDLKPSNVLIYDEVGEGAKIADLGRASMRGRDAMHDQFTIAGAVSYAPPEQVFGITPTRWEERREGCDLYHLGTLAAFLFSGSTPTDHYCQSLGDDIRPRPWRGQGRCDYHTALPLLQSAFTAFVVKIGDDLPEWAKDELSQIIVNACNPDYEKRGDPKARQRVGQPLGIETFVSRFERLSKMALVKVRQ